VNCDRSLIQGQTRHVKSALEVLAFFDAHKQVAQLEVLFEAILIFSGSHIDISLFVLFAGHLGAIVEAKEILELGVGLLVLLHEIIHVNYVLG